MRTGILGGAFDPVHAGHVDIATRAMAALGLDRVLMLPSGEPPYKRCRAGAGDRMEMVRRACEGREGLIPCDIEVTRKGPTYTLDTLKTLKETWPGDSFTYLIGADALDGLAGWYGIQEIARLAGFALVGRPGADRETTERKAGEVSRQTGLSITVTDITGLPVSSGMVRDRVARGKAIDDLVPEGVETFIREKGLYLCDYSEQEILDRLRGTITLHRYHHTLGVADTAQRLAERCGVDPMRARLAGLLHDCAKSMPYGEMRKIVSENVPDTDELELDAEPVLHAPAGMVVARRDYGVKDPSILQAIRRHTLGGPGMTAMDALIYVSDFIEPGRRPFPGLEDVRQLAERDIFAAMRMSARLSSGYLISHGQKPHPKTQCILNDE